MTKEITIDHIGARGDGIGILDGNRVFVPFSAPGETYSVGKLEKRGDAMLAVEVKLLNALEARRTPPCPVFQKCGGCTLQHLYDATIAAQKRDLLIAALQRRGIENAKIGETVTTPPGQRRRARFAVQKTERGWIIGFNERGSKRIVDLDLCPVLKPSLAELPKILRPILDKVPAFGRSGDIHVTTSETGLEICLFPNKPGKLDLDQRYDLTDWAEEMDLARLIWGNDKEPEIIIERRQVMIRFGNRLTAIPPAAFLQPSESGETALAQMVVDACKGAVRVADLYCGCGSLTLPLLDAGHTVHAVEIDAAMVHSIRRSQGGAVSSEQRDLARFPMTAKELAGFDAVVFDPPRAGALAQAEQLAQSDVPVVVAVSCNPGTLARDVRVLLDAGYRIESATPVDQFTWSAHLEALVILKR